MRNRTIGRREAIGFLGGAAALAAAACGGSGSTSPSGTPSSDPVTGTNGSCAVTPSETVGPFPSLGDFVRGDIREGKAGTPLALTIRVVNVNNGCAAIAGAQVEIWHVDAAGNYSQYGSQAAQTFLRGIQTTDAGGLVTFTTNYPGWYQGRATHIHAEVTINGRAVKATQIAFPESVNATVHTSGAYASRGTNPIANAADGIFADSLSAELVTPAGSPSGGYSATFPIAVAV
jgi:protocatechuate 3,4-dioxygenase beta subunit